MIAHVAESGEGRGRVVLHLTQAQPSPVAIEAALRVARAFRSEIESLFVEDATLLEIAALPFTREISLSGRHRRDITPDSVVRGMRAAATELTRRLTELARVAEVPLHMTVVRSDPVTALAEACASCGPWNVVALADPLNATTCAALGRLFASIPGTTGLIVVGPRARRVAGRLIAAVDDIADFEIVLRTAQRLQAASDGTRLTLLLVSDSDAEAETMEQQARLAIGQDETVEILRARVDPGAPAVAAELIRRLQAGFIVGRFGGLIVPREGDLRHLADVLECPLFLMR